MNKMLYEHLYLYSYLNGYKMLGKNQWRNKSLSRKINTLRSKTGFQLRPFFVQGQGAL